LEGLMTAALPAGTVTFLFTDLEVSTRLWDIEPDTMREALARHDEILRDVIDAHSGVIVKGRGDGVHAVFSTADAAVRTAIACEVAMGSEAWPVSEPLRIRIGLHTGVAELRDGDYYGSAVNRAARLMDLAHGGQVVCSQATADLARDAFAEGVALRDLGEHRLRDLSRPEHVFQVQASGLRESFPPLASLDAFPGNLPLQVSSFIGRERELARVSDALDAARVVTLTGVGGVGKTRLALQVAAQVVPRFREGAWLVELAAVRDPEGVPAAFAAVFGLTARADQTVEDSLVEFLRAKQLLLVVDNCEHLLAPVAELVERVERVAAGVVVLATSREGLGLEGEQNLTVPSLAAPAPTDDLDAIAASDAVTLFVQRAQRAVVEFTLTPDNAPAVAQVCRRLDGIALAIELAAARVGVLTPAELARRLDQRFRILAGGHRSTVERHQTLRAMIDWSYELLNEAEQLLLVRLSIFVGGFSFEAAEAVGAGGAVTADAVFDGLAALVARHLVVADTEGIDTRYRLLETIRQYAQERLAELGETEALRAAHAAYFVGFGEEAIPNMMGPEGIDWERRLEREFDNIRAALTWAIDPRRRHRHAVPGDVGRTGTGHVFPSRVCGLLGRRCRARAPRRLRAPEVPRRASRRRVRRAPPRRPGTRAPAVRRRPHRASPSGHRTEHRYPAGSKLGRACPGPPRRDGRAHPTSSRHGSRPPRHRLAPTSAVTVGAGAHHGRRPSSRARRRRRSPRAASQSRQHQRSSVGRPLSDLGTARL
jgi:predicted ATPase/class 3 adenylate cyclase